jgi:hypothetical protein
MSNHNFVKGACHRCAGPFDFPAEAAGETIACPHCGEPTELVAPSKIKRLGRLGWAVGAMLFIVLAVLAATWHHRHQPARAGDPQSQAIPVAAAITSSVPKAADEGMTNPPDEVLTNEFAVSTVTLEKTAGSSLVYVTGKIRNLSSRQRFGVKVEFGLFDAKDRAVGRATDYQPVLDPQGDWHFRALVMESNAESARFTSIREDPP